MTEKLKLFNTESRKVEEIVPLLGDQILLYTCGPTVYNFAHIGNFRCYIFEDLLRRSLKYFGFKLKHVMNITDIDDKTIQGAITQEKALKDFTKPYTRAFFEDLETLNIEKADHYPHATDFIPQMIEVIEALLKKGVAYKGTDGSIYYCIAKFPKYGRLSHLKLDELKVGASSRVASDEYGKDNVADFTLWKAYDMARDGGIFWESPFGKGRPGWHLECSTMAMKLLGETIDIHVGGVDNMFPHHENEIAQSEAFSGKAFVKYWLHCEHLLVNHKKMSKSLGNFYTLRDLLQMGYSGREVRFLLLNSHYRMQLNFTLEGLRAARASLRRLGDFVQRLKAVDETKEGGKVDEILKMAQAEFDASLGDDLNISPAFAAIFEMVRKVNQLIDRHELSQKETSPVLDFLKRVDQVLGVIPFEEQSLDVPKDLKEALQKRNEARKIKNWAEADKQRDFIIAHGYLIEDLPTGSRLKKSK